MAAIINTYNKPVFWSGHFKIEYNSSLIERKCLCKSNYLDQGKYGFELTYENYLDFVKISNNITLSSPTLFKQKHKLIEIMNIEKQKEIKTNKENLERVFQTTSLNDYGYKMRLIKTIEIILKPHLYSYIEDNPKIPITIIK